MTTSAYSAYGTILQLSDGGGTPVYTSIAEIRSIGDVGGERDQLEVTHMESLGKFKEYISGLLDSLMVSMDLNYIVQNATHKDMLTNLQQQTVANQWRGYRLVLPDWGAVTRTFTVDTATDVVTLSSDPSHRTAQPFVVSTSGTLPTSTPQIAAGSVYWLSRTGSTTGKVYPTSADAVAATNAIDFTGTGSGTHTASFGSSFTFTGAFKSAKVSGQVSDVLKISTQLKVRGVATLSP